MPTIRPGSILSMCPLLPGSQSLQVRWVFLDFASWSVVLLRLLRWSLVAQPGALVGLLVDPGELASLSPMCLPWWVLSVPLSPR